MRALTPTRAALGPALLALALGLGACVPTQKSHLLQGESYQSGQERYDGFFSSVGQLRTRTDELDGAQPLRAKVAVAVGLPETAKLDETIEAARARSNELKKDGGRFYVVVATEPKLIVKKGSEENKNAAAFASAVEGAIKGGIQRSNEIEALAKEAAELAQGIPSLEQEVEATFTDGSTRDQVKLELGAAKEILEKAKLKAGTESGQALRFVVLLASAVDSGAAELLALETSAKKEEKPKPKWKGKPGTGKPGKPKPKQDFDP